MGIKDEGKDKQELKNLVEGSVEKKLKEFSKETEKNRAKDKKEILKELKTREEKGLNTLAQKFELLKLKAEQSNKQQSKNPLVELSDKNLKWLSEHAIANQKPENMGKGLVKNVISSIKNTEKSEGVPAPLGTLPMPPQEEETATKSILKSKMTLEEKVDEIHKFVTKGIVKEQKNTSAILSKGIKGLTSSMKLIGDTVGQIFDKGKMIAQLVTAGALGLVYLVGWWKQGGPKKLAESIQKGVLDGIIKNLPWNKEKDNKDLNSEDYTRTTADSINSSILKGDDYSNYLDNNKTNFTGVSGSTEFSNKSKDGSYTQQGREFSVGNLTPVLAPIDGTISDVKSKVGSLKGGTDRMYFNFTLYGKGGASKDSGMTQNVVSLRFENILNIKVHNGQKVSIGQILGFADGSFKITQTMGNTGSGKQILDDYQGLINKNKDNNWENSIKTTKENLKDKDYDKINSTLVDEIVEKQSQQRATSKYTNGIYNVGNKITNKWALRKQEDKDKFLQSIDGPGEYNVGNKTEGAKDGYSEQEIPKANLTQISENQQKLKEQSNKLQEVETKPIETPQQPQVNTTGNPQPEPNRTTVVTPSRPDNMIVPNNLSGNLLEESLPISQGIK